MIDMSGLLPFVGCCSWRSARRAARSVAADTLMPAREGLLLLYRGAPHRSMPPMAGR